MTSRYNATSAVVTNDPNSILNRIIFRAVQPTDIPRCYQIESESYPPDEAASKSTLQYRQHHAAPFFRCAFLIDDGCIEASGNDSGADDNASITSISSNVESITSTNSSISYKNRNIRIQSTVRGTIIGFICSTRCSSFTAEAMRTHHATGKILAIHSVVVEEQYRKMGVATAMMQDYLHAMDRLNNLHGRRGGLKVKMDKIVLMAKKDLLAFYVRNGFKAMCVSAVVHGKEQWFELEREVMKMDAREDKEYECHLVDSFADPDKKGSGNPAGVVILKGPPGGEQLGTEMSIDNNADDHDDELDDIVNDSDNIECLQTFEMSSRGLDWMALVAKEFNHSETAFVWPLPQKPTSVEDSGGTSSSSYAIRYFTCSGAEVDLCGHATLAPASILLGKKLVEESQETKQGNKITFHAKRDLLRAEVYPASQSSSGNALSQPDSSMASSNSSLRVAMDFPWKNVTPVPLGPNGHDAVSSMLQRAFRCATPGNSNSFPGESESALKSSFRNFFTAKDASSTPPLILPLHILHIGTTDGDEDLFVELTEQGFDMLKEMKDIDYGVLADGWKGYSRGVAICCCTSQSAAGPSETDTTRIQNQSGSVYVDFRSRFFGPKVGIEEDPVTGSAHCYLGPYFGNKLGKDVVVGRQESERGGIVECILKRDEGRVCIVGTAVTTVSGKLKIGI